jgi:CDP-diacylglycerol--serine O-phosphatidyltransferase
MTDRPDPEDRHDRRERRRLRMRRHGRRAYIRSVYFLPSMATLGNAVCGFAAAYVAALPASAASTSFLAAHRFAIAAYLIFGAGLCDVLDGRLARFTRHTTDFGGQLDSLADVISFGVAPGLLCILLCRDGFAGALRHVPLQVDQLIWAIGALYMCCAAVRLARFNVSNEHGEQHHFSFLGLPSPGAGIMVAAWVLMQQDLTDKAIDLRPDVWVWLAHLVGFLSSACLVVLPLLTLGCGLLMVSHIRYPHLVNRYLKGRRSIGRLITMLVFLLLIIVAHQYVVALATVGYVLWGTLLAAMRMRRARAAG